MADFARLATPIQATYSEINNRAHDDALVPLTRTPGSFHMKTVKGRRYWYQRVVEDGKPRDLSLGPDTPDMAERIERMKADAVVTREALDERRRLVRALNAAGLPAPDALSGRVMAKLADVGIFRMGGVLGGTHAFRTYGPMLGVRLPAETGITGDVDIVSVTIGSEERTEPLDHVLKAVDARFKGIASMVGQGGTYRWRLDANGQVVLVELLTTFDERDQEDPTPQPTFGAMAKPLRFMEFSMEGTVTSTVLHDAGVPVIVPDPARYACHKLIVAQVRGSGAPEKRRKDLDQSRQLFEVMLQDRPADVDSVFSDLLSRGPKWRSHAAGSVATLPDDIRETLLAWAGDHPDFVERVRRLRPKTM
ncbi:GSU2403 family nucleotidyltransferase fold protein [Azospirillum picis]|uniref:Nucleotidyltransferase-like domain-containing protein n=1 Tax=Azospirillum picis TaxID=488438 RepID=A0ABU0MKD2_9PROT|nr:GSU2403 family nucleotidyltransferase fold protein [Azospirillum picis]MBP2300250.1 hypothetical protein [Azospirillum picis]MDQ0533908.1 hypothetical protein [Azospirillum picis]